MKVIINEELKNKKISEWMEFKKVRAIIKNQDGEYAITHEGGKIIFPGGKQKKDEDELTAIKRELKEETGLEFEDKELQPLMVLETYYDDFYDYRSDSIKPRHTITTIYGGIATQPITAENLSLSTGEIAENFNIFFVNKEKLIDLLNKDHSDMTNGRQFDEENKVILQKVLTKF